MRNQNKARKIRNLSLVLTASIGGGVLAGEGIKDMTTTVENKSPAKVATTESQGQTTSLYPIRELPDGYSTPIYATIEPSKPGEPVKASFSLVNKNKLPQGVHISKTTETVSSNVDTISANLTAPTNETLKGDIGVKLTVTEPHPETKVNKTEEIPYLPTPQRPS